MRIIRYGTIIIIIIVLTSKLAFSHCQIPCGIYDDEMRVEMISEHITTIQKSINKLQALIGQDTTNYNQIVRWTMNKEKHAQYIQEIVCEYFLAQRIKYVDASDEGAHAKYVRHVIVLHQIIVSAMEAKQTTDIANVDSMRTLVDAFKKSYFNAKQ